MVRTGWQRTRIRTLTTLMTLAVMTIIFCFSMENAETSDQRSGVISGIVLRIVYPEYEQMEISQKQVVYDRVQLIVRKCAHFSEYTLLGFMVRLCMESWFGHRCRRRSALLMTAIGSGTVYACTDEVHQIAIDGRFGTWRDVLVDGCGVLTGVVLGTMLIRWLEKRKQGKTTETDRGE